MAGTIGRRSGYDREEAAATRQATLETMHTQLAEQVGKLASQDAWKSWLRFANGFHRFSFNNTIMIWAQRPDATLVAGYRAWQAKGRQVRRGETAIKVYGPVTMREPELDPGGKSVRGPDGKPVMQVRIVGVKPVSVFDVSQTVGDPLPSQPEAKLLTGQAPPGLWDALQSFVESHGYTVTRGDCDGANGVTMFDSRQVRVRDDIDDAASVRTLAHEAGHVVMHHPEQREPFSCRGVVEVEAEAVAFMVSSAHGLDASQYTFNYVAGWAHQAATPGGPSVEDIIKSTGQRVIRATDTILQATQPVPTVADEALTDLTVQVTRPMDAVEVTETETFSVAVPETPATHATAQAADSPPSEGTQTRSATHAAAVWERVETRPLDGAAAARRAVPTRTPARGVAVAR